MPSTKIIDPKHSYAKEKFEKLIDYTRYMNGRIKEPHNPVSQIIKSMFRSGERNCFKWNRVSTLTLDSQVPSAYPAKCAYFFNSFKFRQSQRGK